MDPDLEINRRTWDTWADIHFESEFYGVEAFRRGELSLPGIDRSALEPVTGLRLLHLQCHFGMDTLSWARLGADVTGVDFSPRAIALARRLADECGVAAAFVEADVYATPERVTGRFDRVVATAGVLPWLPDLQRWGAVVARMLKPGGRFYLREFHPISQIFSPVNGSAEAPLIRYPYFPTAEPVRESGAGTYAQSDAEVTTTTCEWSHPLTDVIQALVDAGLVIVTAREFPYTTYQALPWLELYDDGYWYWPMSIQPIPLMYSVQAVKPNTRSTGLLALH